MHKNNLASSKLFVFLALLIPLAVPATAQQTGSPESVILITGARIFDGSSPQLIEGRSVLIEGNKIARIAQNIPAPAGATVINAGGRVMMPGMIDAHWHSLFATISQAKLLQSDNAYINLYAAQANHDALLRGFTAVRDVGGNVFGLKKATDEGLLVGPRIYPSGGYISQTSGHGDFRGPLDVPENPGAPLDYFQRTGQTLIADGVPEVTKRTREVLRMGASQIKVMAGGGVSSLYDPLDVTQYTFGEMKAIVDVAKTWNTYVTVHANTDAAIRQAIEAGVLCVEHGFLLKEDTIKLMAEEGVWLSIQPLLDDEDAIPFPDPVSRAKWVQVTNGTDKVYKLAKKYKVKIAWGTDTLFDPGLAKKQGKMVTKLSKWFTPYEALKMVTYDNAQLLKLSGPRDPYPGELGIVKEGALADLILVDGNPLQNFDLVADPERNFVVIMKDGKIFKNTVASARASNNAASETVVGRQWLWVSSITPVERIEVKDPKRFSLVLQTDGHAQIQFDCNRGGGSYQMTDGKLSFGLLISTRMACPSDSQDAVFMRQLENVTSYFLKDGELFLEMPVDSGTMRFVGAAGRP